MYKLYFPTVKTWNQLVKYTGNDCRIDECAMSKLFCNHFDIRFIYSFRP